MVKQKLKRRGQLVRSKEGEIALVNDEKQGFKVDEMVLVIWDLSDGRSEQEIVDEIVSKGKAEKKKVAPVISDIISGLRRAKLVE